MSLHGLITGKDVAGLSHDAFRKVMNALLAVEASLHGLPLTDINLTTRDTDPDGGVDAMITWPTAAPHDFLLEGRGGGPI